VKSEEIFSFRPLLHLSSTSDRAAGTAGFGVPAGRVGRKAAAGRPPYFPAISQIVGKPRKLVRWQLRSTASDAAFMSQGLAKFGFLRQGVKPSRKRHVTGYVWRGASAISLGNN
jgi:hypothetical protein